MVDLPELRSVVRQEAVLSSAAVVARGGPDTDLKLRAHALRTARAFTLDGGPALGVSVFAALDDIGAASLEGIMSGRLSTYRLVHVVTVGEVEAAGFTLLPTFTRPHMTLLLAGLGQVESLRVLLGRAQPNPHYGEMTGRRRR